MTRSIFFQCLIISGFLFLIPVVTSAVDTLSLQSYVSIAVQKNPQMKISKASVQSAVANKSSVLSRLLPQVGAQAQAGLSNSQSQAPGSYNGGDYSTGVSASQLVFDFGKSWISANASSRLVDASRYDEQNTRQSVVLNATTAYFNYLLAQMQYGVAQDALLQTRAHLNQAQALFETGKQARFTITKAEVDQANAEVSAITAKNGVKLAMIQMEVAAGTPFGDSLVLTDSLDVSEPDITREQALLRAMDVRPDLAVLKSRCEAARLQVASAKSALMPDLNAKASGGYGRTDITDWNWNYGVSLSLSAPIYQGGYLVAAVRSAQASYDQAMARFDFQKQAIASEVEQDYYQKSEAFERISATKKLVGQAAEGLELSKQRFAAGAAPSLEVTDAEATLATAKSSHAQALFDYRVAHAKLVTATGGL
jgi:outer membrane protein